MKGSPSHEYQIDRLETACLANGAECKRNAQSQPGSKFSGFIDLVAKRDGVSVGFEIEMQSRRAMRDCRKADDLGLCVLVIVAPTYRIMRLIQQRIATYRPTNERLVIHSATLGQALGSICDYFSIV